MTTIDDIKGNHRCILITGVAGFIGSHLAKRMLVEGYRVIGIDSLTPFYDISIKRRRLSELQTLSTMGSFLFYEMDITSIDVLKEDLCRENLSAVIHLAARAGAVSSKSDEPDYVHNNVVGFEAVLQFCAFLSTPLVYASSSSVYGNCPNLPFKESEGDLRPGGIYAQTKLENEKLASHQEQVNAIGLRFFSVYGEDMRPDMGIFKFAEALKSHMPIVLYGDNTARDFTYISDIIQAIMLILVCLEQQQPLAPIYNIGNGFPISIARVLHLLESHLGKSSSICYLPLRKGEMKITHSNTSLLQRDIGFIPQTSIEEGIHKFVSWYQNYG